VSNERLDILAANQLGRALYSELYAPHARPVLSDLVGELATQSEPFRTRWAAHNVRFHNTGVKHFHHPSSASFTSATTALTSPQTTG
jgi:hypothetical protein